MGFFKTGLSAALMLVAAGAGADTRVAVHMTELVAAARSGDRSELDLAAKRAGPRRIRDSLLAGLHVHTALLAADLSTWQPTQAWLLLDATSQLSTSHDRPIAVAAARATHTLAASLRNRDPAGDVPASALSLVQKRCLQTAQRTEIWADVRVLNLECAVALARSAHIPSLLLLDDDDPQVRLAAASLLMPPTTDQVRARLATVLRNDPDDDVAAAAAAALCLDDTPKLSDQDRARIVRLLAVPTLDPGAASILSTCPRAI